jgi:hypothetical protein
MGLGLWAAIPSLAGPATSLLPAAFFVASRGYFLSEEFLSDARYRDPYDKRAILLPPRSTRPTAWDMSRAPCRGCSSAEPAARRRDPLSGPQETVAPPRLAPARGRAARRARAGVLPTILAREGQDPSCAARASPMRALAGAGQGEWRLPSWPTPGSPACGERGLHACGSRTDPTRPVARCETVPPPFLTPTPQLGSRISLPRPSAPRAAARSATPRGALAAGFSASVSRPALAAHSRGRRGDHLPPWAGPQDAQGRPGGPGAPAARRRQAAGSAGLSCSSPARSSGPRLLRRRRRPARRTPTARAAASSSRPAGRPRW